MGPRLGIHLVFPFAVLRHTRLPDAAKAFLLSMMERPQYERVLENSVGYVGQGLRAYDDGPPWQRDPKVRFFRDVAARGRLISYAGQLGPAAAAALADSVAADMFAGAVSGQASPRNAVARAERRAQRIYRG